MYIFNRRQDEELDALSASVQRIGGVGLTIHDELVGQVFPFCMYNNSYELHSHLPFFHTKCLFYCVMSSKFHSLSHSDIYAPFACCTGEASGRAKPRYGNYYESA